MQSNIQNVGYKKIDPKYLQVRGRHDITWCASAAQLCLHRNTCRNTCQNRKRKIRSRDEGLEAQRGVGSGAEVERESEGERVPLTITPPLDEHRLDAEVSEIGQKGIVPKAMVQM